MSMFSIIESLGKMTAIASFFASIAYIRRLEEFRAYLRFKAITEQSALRTGNGTHLLAAGRRRALGWVVENTFMSKLALASGRLSLSAYVRADFAADRCPILSGPAGDTGKRPSEGERSLDQQTLVIVKMLHNRSFPAGYKDNCKTGSIENGLWIYG